MDLQVTQNLEQQPQMKTQDEIFNESIEAVQIIKDQVIKKVLIGKNDKEIFTSINRGWFENLLDFDILSLQKFEEFVESRIEQENSYEILQLWIFYRDVIRVCYNLVALKWFTFAKECYPTVQAIQAWNNFLQSIQEDCNSKELSWQDQKFTYFFKKISGFFNKENWVLEEINKKLLIQLEKLNEQGLQWAIYYADYNQRLFKEIRHQLFKSDWSFQLPSFQDHFKSWYQIAVTNAKELPEYSIMVVENGLLMNQSVRPSFFQDLKLITPLQAREIQLQACIGWRKGAYYVNQFNERISLPLNQVLTKIFSVEKLEEYKLKKQHLQITIQKSLPLKLKQVCQNVEIQLGLFEDPSNVRTHFLQRDLKEVEQEKKNIEEKIQLLIEESNKSQETTESRLDKINLEYETNKQLNLEQLELNLQYLTNWRENNRQQIIQANEIIQERQQLYDDEFKRQQDLRLADIEYSKQVQKEQPPPVKIVPPTYLKQKELLKEEVIKNEFQQKLEQVNQVKQQILEKQMREKRKEELVQFEKEYFEQQEKIQQLVALKKKLPPALKPEQIAEQQKMLQELQQLRELEKEEEAERLRLAEIARKEQSKELPQLIGEYLNNKQNDISQWVQKKGENISQIEIIPKAKRLQNWVINNVGETMLWSASLLSTLFFGPIDNLKLLNQLGNKSSYIYKKQFEAALQSKEIQIPQYECGELVKTYQEFYLDLKPNPITKGNIVRLLKHNVFGSDAMALGLFKLGQDQLMRYTHGTYQNYNNFIAGALSGAVLGVLMNPLDMFKTLYVATDMNYLVRLNRATLGIFTGMRANIISNGLFRGLQFSLYEKFKKTKYMNEFNISSSDFDKSTSYKNFNSYNQYLTLGQKYASALSATFISSLISYPLDTAKRYIYTNFYVDQPKLHIKSIPDALTTYTNWYGGFKYQCFKIVLRPFALVLWDHAASVLCQKSFIHNNFY